MRNLLKKTTFLTAALLLVLATAASGAPGDPIIIGAKNQAGSSTTVLTGSPSSSHPVFRVQRQGSVAGPALRGDANGVGHGVVGSTQDPVRFGVWGRGAGTGSFGVFASNDLGLTGDLRDTAALDVMVGGNRRALRLEPAMTSPNVIGGHEANDAAAEVRGAAIGGGGTAAGANEVDGDFGTVGGGLVNSAGGKYATVGGGSDNAASVAYATVGGGFDNTASGLRATVPGGSENTAGGYNSFAAGRNAKANHNGTYVWADSQLPDMASSGDNQWISRAQGRFFFQSDSTLDDQGGFINTSTGAYLSMGGTWTNASDEAMKKDLRPVDAEGVLQAVAELPISTWSYISEDGGVRHMGPTAQDFRAAFGLGSDERTIATVDADGVALAAIQGLQRQVSAQEQVIAEQDGRIAALEERLAPAAAAASSSGFPPFGPALYGLGFVAMAGMMFLTRRGRVAVG